MASTDSDRRIPASLGEAEARAGLADPGDRELEVLVALLRALDPGRVPVQLLQQLGQLLSWQGGPVNWDLARQAARQTVAAAGDPLGAQVQILLDVRRGPVEDVDLAEESINLNRSKLLLKAGVFARAQANANAQRLVNLIG